MRHLLLLLCIVMPMLLSAQTYSIGSRSITINDPVRSNRSIGLDIYYPANAAGSNVPAANDSFPLIVIGHGFSMTVDAYEIFWTEYVPQGYIIALPKTEVGPVPFPSHSSFGQDLSYTVNWFLAENNDNGSNFYQRVSKRVAVMGHSMGGGCSFLAAEQNSNITTIITFAAAETNPSAISAAANVSIPALVFAASLDNVTPPGDHQIPMYNALTSSCKTRVTINNGSHCGFANPNTLCSFGETTVCMGCNFIDRAAQHSLQFQVLTPWLEFYLKQDCTKWPVMNNVLSSTATYSVVKACTDTLPTAKIVITGSTALCTIDTTYLQGIGSTDLLWSTGETTSNIEITNEGAYSLSVSGYNGCVAVDSLTITSNNTVKPIFQGVPSSPVCAGDSVSISTRYNYDSYAWSTGDTTAQITVGLSGNFHLRATDVNGCTVSSDTFTVNIAQPYLQPDILLSNDSLLASTAGTISYWTYNGSPLADYTGDFLYPITEGDYQLAVLDSNGCETLSTVYTYTITDTNDTTTGIPFITEAELQLYPNPASNHLQIAGIPTVRQISIYSITGESLFEVHQPSSLMIDLSNITDQLCIIHIQTTKNSYIRKVLIQR